ncbi:MAG: uncharacterized protein JWR83_1496 [Aeromicrobium sp.]|nr:uncharacterized protein [Aeromicrobium sp.]
MKPDDERLTRLHEALVERVEQLVSGDDFIRFVAESARFHRYSPQNRLLIACQLVDRGVEPDGVTASYKTWTRVPAEGGGTCQVAKGEKALWIYAPMTATQRVIDDPTGDERVVSAGVRGFKPVPVFHQSQLDRAPALPEPPTPELLRGDDAPARVWDAVVSELAVDGYAVGLVERASGATWNGQTSFTSREVRVHDDLDPPQRLKTLLHEWAHATMGHENRVSESSRHIAEVEAESVAYLLCDRVGVDSQQYTVPYVSGWAGSVEVVKATAERVLGATSKLIDTLENRLAIDLTPDLLALAGPVTTTVEDHLARAGDRLLSADRADLLGRPAPERIAALLASAGFDAGETAATFRQLGTDRQTASIAMTAIHPYDTVDHAVEPLYDPTTVRSVLADAYTTPTPTPAAGHGLRLIQKWAQMANGPAVQAAVPTR